MKERIVKVTPELDLANLKTNNLTLEKLKEDFTEVIPLSIAHLLMRQDTDLGSQDEKQDFSRVEYLENFLIKKCQSASEEDILISADNYKISSLAIQRFFED